MKTKRKIEYRPFLMGQIVFTPGALEKLHPDDIGRAIVRHAGCDWGDCEEDDWAENDFSLDKDLRLFSVYHDRNGIKFWIITEADRSVTTILLAP